MRYSLLIFIIMLITCSSLQELDTKTENLSYQLKDMKVEIEKPWFLGFTRTAKVQGYVATPKNWSLKGYHLTVSENDVISGKVRSSMVGTLKHHYSNDNELQADALASLDDKEGEPVLIYKIDLVFEPSNRRQVLMEKFNFTFDTGVPWGHNFIIIKYLEEHKAFYWYRDK